MAGRIGINDAPEVVLGAGGVTQVVPVLQVGADFQRTPGKTTIARMLEYFTGGAIISPQIQRFFVTGEPAATLSIPLSLRQDFSEAVTIPLRKEANSLIVGDEDFYTVTDGGITFSEAGTYRAFLNIFTNTTAPDPSVVVEGGEVTVPVRIPGQTIEADGIIPDITDHAADPEIYESFSLTGRVEGNQIHFTGVGETLSTELLIALTDEPVNVTVTINPFNRDIVARVADATSTFVQAAFLPVVTLVGDTVHATSYGESIPIFQVANRFSSFGTVEVLFKAPANETITLAAQLYTIRGVPGDDRTAQFTFSNAFAAVKSEVQIERLAR